MKTWKKQASIPKIGVVTVKELRDKEATVFCPPSSHGFVNLYKGDKHVGWCGIDFAKRHIIEV